MAKANTFTRVIEPSCNLGAAGAQEEFPVAASQTIRQGDFVQLSSNLVAQALAANGTAYGGTVQGNTDTLLGIALADITSNSGAVEAATGRTEVPVMVFDQSTEIVVRVVNATALNGNANTLLSSGAAAAALSTLNVGSRYNLCRVTLGSSSNTVYAMDNTVDASGRFVLVAKIDGQQTTDVFPVCKFRPVYGAQDI